MPAAPCGFDICLFYLDVSYRHASFQDTIQELRELGALVKVQDSEFPITLLEPSSRGGELAPAELLTSYVDALVDEGSVSEDLGSRLIDRGKTLLTAALGALHEGSGAVSLFKSPRVTKLKAWRT